MLRFLGDMEAALAGPPLRPPSRPRATAFGFFMMEKSVLTLARAVKHVYAAPVDASLLIGTIARAFEQERLEAVLVGNAAAALHGAPVTTDDFDFMFRPTKQNIEKLLRVATLLGASVSQPEYPLSRFYRILNREVGLQVDMMGVVEGITSFESLRSRAEKVSFGNASLKVADLIDVIKSKRTAGRPKDRAVLPVLEETLRLRNEK